MLQTMHTVTIKIQLREDNRLKEMNIGQEQVYKEIRWMNRWFLDFKERHFYFVIFEL